MSNVLHEYVDMAALEDDPCIQWLQRRQTGIETSC